jgi:hypothetical protein
MYEFFERKNYFGAEADSPWDSPYDRLS